MTELSAPPTAFQVEVLANEQNPATPAILDTIATEVRKALQQAGYRVEPAYTGARGGELFDILTNIALVEGILGGIVTIVGGVISAVKTIQDMSDKKSQEAPPMTINITLNGIPLLEPAKQDVQQFSIKQLEERIKQLEEQNQQAFLLSEKSSATTQAKITLQAQQSGRKKRR